MIKTLYHLLRLGSATRPGMFPDLRSYTRGLPTVTSQACHGCRACESACPTQAVQVKSGGAAPVDAQPANAALCTGVEVTIDLGRCLACGECVAACPTGTIQKRLDTRVAVRKREHLIARASASVEKPVDGEAPPTGGPGDTPFRASIHLREVSTGDNATDLEVGASGNPIYDSSRFGVHVVASPRHADALIVTGPVALAMQEPLRRCYHAMAEPRLVIAAGASAISGCPWDHGYAGANGVDAILPVTTYVPGNPPHPWYVLHGILLAMGHPAALG